LKTLFVRLKEVETDGQSSIQQSARDVSVNGEIHRQRDDLASLRQQMNSESEALRRLRREYDSAQREMELLLEAIDKRHQLLESLDFQLDSDITARRHDIEVLCSSSQIYFDRLKDVRLFSLLPCCWLNDRNNAPSINIVPKRYFRVDRA